MVPPSVIAFSTRSLPMSANVPRMSTGKREPDDLSRSIANEINGERHKQRLTQADVYTSAGITRTPYIKIESGKYPADSVQLASIARALGLKTSTLVIRAEANLTPALARKTSAQKARDYRERTHPTEPGALPARESGT